MQCTVIVLTPDPLACTPLSPLLPFPQLLPLLSSCPSFSFFLSFLSLPLCISPSFFFSVVCVHDCNSDVISRRQNQSHHTPPHPWVLIVLPSPLLICSLGFRGSGMDVPFRTAQLEVTYSQHCDQLWVLALIVTLWPQRLFWPKLPAALVCG